jgi:uncharacterized protein with PQ loop repeat
VIISVAAMNLPVLAGSISTCLFMASVLPMLIKAWRTKDLESYSLGNLVTSNVANLFYSVYVASLPVGPVWALHGFYLGATALMLFWALRYRRRGNGNTSPLPQRVRHSIDSAPSLAYQEVAA